jgi:alpha-beta hydrolase superfamily lysophospholipase
MAGMGMPEEFEVTDPDGLTTVVLRWAPDGPPRAAVQILHGWAEHARRYDRPARALAAAGYVVYADDHRGHGQSGVRGDSLGDLGPREMDGVLDAVRAVTAAIQEEQPGLPLFILGHSWGSFILQAYLRTAPPAGLTGALLTGTTWREPGVPRVRTEPNARFEPARTAYDWLSRDEAEVDLYVADPLCGFEMMRGGARPGQVTGGEDGTVPRDLPVIILNGSDDPVGGDEGGERLAGFYRSLGLGDVTFRGYPGGRHELLNETNRDEVTADILAWIAAHVPAAEPAR